MAAPNVGEVANLAHVRLYPILPHALSGAHPALYSSRCPGCCHILCFCYQASAALYNIPMGLLGWDTDKLKIAQATGRFPQDFQFITLNFGRGGSESGHPIDCDLIIIRFYDPLDVLPPIQSPSSTTCESIVPLWP